ncbi:MAG: CtsR family transcriptional regulator [Clostridiaceae bacterium]
MARLSDLIEIYLKELISETRERELEIQRNVLANQFSCAPSQINYVLTTRFTTDKGYFIESKRGGGGCIRIKMIEYSSPQKTLKEAIFEKIGDNITYNNAVMLIDSLFERGLITEREGNIIKASINDRILQVQDRNYLRALILKSAFLSILI